MLLISSKVRVRCYLSVVGKGSGFRYNIDTRSEPPLNGRQLRKTTY